MKSMLIFYLVYEFLELIHITQSYHINFYSDDLCLPAFALFLLPLLPLLLLYPGTGHCLTHQGLPCPQTIGQLAQFTRAFKTACPLYPPRSSKPSKLFGCCWHLQLPPPPTYCHPNLQHPGVQPTESPTSPAASVPTETPSLKITIWPGCSEYALICPHPPPFPFSQIIPNPSEIQSPPSMKSQGIFNFLPAGWSCHSLMVGKIDRKQV